MSAKRLLKRVLTVMVMTVCIFMLLTVMRAEAMPIRPDVRKVLAQPRVSPAQFAPARAGWDGPESARPTQTLNTTFDQLGPGGTVRAVKESLLSAALPDYRALAAIALIILLLRRMRKDRRSAELAAAAAPAIVVQVSDPAAEPKIDRAA
jgi:hypothetical protein